MDTNQGQQKTADEYVTAYEHDCIIRAAEHVGQALALLRMADTPETRNIALEIRPFIGRIEEIR